MRAWYFSENAYPYLPDPKTFESIRVSLPNRNYDPKIGAELYHRYLDEWQTAEDLGLDLMLNEHHSTATNLNPSARGRAGCAHAHHQDGAHPDPRQSDRQPARSGARRRGNGDGRQLLARAPRSRFRARRSVRDLRRQQQPGAHGRPAVGSARSDRQGVDVARRARSTGKAVTSTTVRSTFGRGPTRSRTRRSGSPRRARRR